MDFMKMHGAGNDFVVLDGRSAEQEWGPLSIAMCDRHYGVGADGILIVVPSKTADFRMRMFNPDGSESEMCGNGIRCFTKYLVDADLAAGRELLTIETLAGVHEVSAKGGKNGVQTVRVDMGRPRYRPAEVPVAGEGPGPLIDLPLVIDGQTILVTCLSMGNPHAVAFVDQPVKDWPLERLGPLVENHPFFPRRVNFEIVNIVDRGHVNARVWERGAGLTLACGSGACAIAVAAWMHGRVGGNVDVTLPGGTLNVQWDGSGEVWLEGPAETVYKGQWMRQLS